MASKRLRQGRLDSYDRFPVGNNSRTNEATGLLDDRAVVLHSHTRASTNPRAPSVPSLSLPSTYSLGISPPKDRRGFKIAIICALTLETDAVESVFDQHWDADDDPYGKASGDRNSYSTGVIAHHNVVLVHMPGTGKGSAASVAESCRRSFTEIELALVVGICGGVPFDENREEIFLGDVVISSGIVQYDFGRRYPDRFVRKDTLDDNLGRPNPEIRGFLRKLQRRKGRADLRDKMIKYLGDLQTELGEAATYPGIAEEKLFRPSYRHRHQIPSTCPTCAASVGRRDPVCEAAVQSSCDQLGCDETELIPRRRPDNQDYALHQPAIHFGLVASGDTVMKSGQDRDEIAAKEHVIAFEMEGAGVWDNLPCVVIKGVCDYADSHKNEKWQNYAAATAAAGMKAFLNNWSTGSRDIM